MAPVFTAATGAGKPPSFFCFFMFLFGKGEQVDLTHQQSKTIRKALDKLKETAVKASAKKTNMFSDLMEGIEEATRFRKGEATTLRITKVAPPPDLKPSEIKKLLWIFPAAGR